MLVVQLNKQIITQKLVNLQRKLLLNHDKYITTPDFNTLAASVFNARLAQADLITKTDLMLNCQVLIEKLPQINQNIQLKSFLSELFY